MARAQHTCLHSKHNQHAPKSRPPLRRVPYTHAAAHVPGLTLQVAAYPASVHETDCPYHGIKARIRQPIRRHTDHILSKEAPQGALCGPCTFHMLAFKTQPVHAQVAPAATPRTLHRVSAPAVGLAALGRPPEGGPPRAPEEARPEAYLRPRPPPRSPSQTPLYGERVGNRGEEGLTLSRS